MNNCILMAEILQDPQLRYTSDTQREVAEMLVQFDGLREGEAPSRLKVIAWGNLAVEVQKRYRQGDRLAIEGRLSINTIDRSEGFKEKRAELVAQRIFAWGSNEPPLSSTPPGTTTVAQGSPVTIPATPTPTPVGARAASPVPPPQQPSPATPVHSPPPRSESIDEPLQDDIPF